MKTYRTKREESGIAAGTIVYDLMKCDFGCASDDTRNLGEGFIEYISVTLNPKGDYPGFTMRKKDLEVISGEL